MSPGGEDEEMTPHEHQLMLTGRVKAIRNGYTFEKSLYSRTIGKFMSSGSEDEEY